MIHQPDYIKSLLKKHMERTASANEEKILMAAWELYDNDELAAMIAEVEKTVNYPLVKDIKDWEPLAGEVIRMTKEKQREKKMQRYVYGMYVAACIILIFGIVNYFVVQNEKNGMASVVCNGLPGDSDIPTDEFSCRVVLDTNQQMTIDRTKIGQVWRFGSIELIQEKPGVLEYRTLPSSKAADSARDKYHVISTSANQQYQILLMDGTKVRLNAMTAIRIPLSNADKMRFEVIAGEVFIERKSNNITSLIVKTRNGEMKATASTFNVNVGLGATIAVAVSGNLIVKDTVGHEAKLNSCDIASMGTIKMKTGKLIDTMFIERNKNINQLLVWKKVNRVYSNTHLRDFVADISIWYGLKFENLNCLPNRYIKAQLCYKASMEDMLAVFRKNGVAIHFNGGVLTFCDPAPNPKVVHTAYLER
ncbi:MAG: hypothetical protein BGO52_18015 [Sphingobacteriales bacterium 44-61]|nr:MAG: hypothetical protein BGO52_18015 [Sphingobacteriales bacterium 44-61]